MPNYCPRSLIGVCNRVRLGVKFVCAVYSASGPWCRSLVTTDPAILCMSDVMRATCMRVFYLQYGNNM